MPCRLLLQDDRGPDGVGTVVAEWERYLAEHGPLPAMNVFDAATLPSELGLEYLTGDSMTPGCAHYFVLWFAKHVDAQFLWVIEGDVEYTGSWRDFFCAFEQSGAALITGHLTTYQQDPEWYWWPWLRTSDGGPLDTRQWQKAFLPVYRISAPTLRLLYTCQRQVGRGHFEELAPTLLVLNGFEVRDLRDILDCYVGTAIESWKPLTTSPSLRWRPPISNGERRTLALRTPPCLLHPIKDDLPAECADPRISVVMTTFNGVAHLGPQLASLEAQSRPPDEVIIIDDASEDATWDLLLEFQATTRLQVLLARQQERVGYVKNFADALDNAPAPGGHSRPLPGTDPDRSDNSCTVARSWRGPENGRPGSQLAVDCRPSHGPA